MQYNELSEALKALKLISFAENYNSIAEKCTQEGVTHVR